MRIGFEELDDPHELTLCSLLTQPPREPTTSLSHTRKEHA
jgi:hypothetical protein